MKYNKITISITNELYGKLMSQCSVGHEKKESCILTRPKKDHTRAFIVADTNRFIIYYYPYLICKQHGQKCSIYGEDQNDEERMYLNTEQGDELINAPYFVTLVPMKSTAPYTRFCNRLHISKSLLHILHQDIVADNKSPSKFAQSIQNHYIVKLSQQLSEDNDFKHIHISMTNLKNDFDEVFNHKDIEKSYRQILIVYLGDILHSADMYVCCNFIHDLYWDATHSVGITSIRHEENIS